MKFRSYKALIPALIAVVCAGVVLAVVLAQGGNASADGEASGIADDRYPALRFERLPQEMRAEFVRQAGATLCPCRGIVASLDQCLQSAEQSCPIAIDAGAIMLEQVMLGTDDLEITAMIQRYVIAARASHSFDFANTAGRGTETPDVVVVEFADFQCPHCRRVAESLTDIVDEHGSRVRVYFKHFPLSSHRNSIEAALAAAAANRQGKFWEMHDLIFTNQDRIRNTQDPLDLFQGWARDIGLDLEQFATDFNDPALYRSVREDKQEGVDAGVSGTPTLFVNGVRMLESPSHEAIVGRITTLLADIDAGSAQPWRQGAGSNE